MKRTTIKDVAERAGVSTAAVSYVMNGREHKVSEDTLAKIRKAAAELNYIPDYSARSLASKRSSLIGVVIPQTEDQKRLLLENPFYSDLICGIESELRQHGYHVLISGVDKGQGYLDLTMQRNLDGAVIMGIYQENFYEELKKVDIPIVLIDSYINDDHFKKIRIDDELGGYLATKHLIEKGHVNIGLVTGMIRKDGVVEKRYLGYKRALQEANLFYDHDLVYEGQVSYEYGLEAGKQIAARQGSMTAVFVTSDMMAFGVINGLREKGLQVPEDLSVIGFDDISLAGIFHPKLTTVHQDIKERGITAAKHLIGVIEGNENLDMGVTLQPISVIERETVRRMN
ncbi:LacI family transcriptional regulator [Paenibacillus donghaensis]|uniref:LacI family DNA-binding transcriptional regulator n=1 Tax=Paenibacillus donghaensis TaxID=414771 RepID=UPI001883ABC2|nr:LacI family DNA-binding transcriptional regulator [Paenibacillus donghaensis]MBE9917549.1 LacI family transcriptional regulator [Paenibacillus donghaensis]